MKYRIHIEKCPNNYSAHSPDVPGCIATGKTRAEVARNLKSAIEFHLECYLPEEIRAFAGDKYIKPLWKKGGVAQIRAGDVHRDMNLDGPMRVVCGALDTKLFREFYNVDLVSRKGPHQGADTLFTFKVHPLHQPRRPVACHAQTGAVPSTAQHAY